MTNICWSWRKKRKNRAGNLLEDREKIEKQSAFSEFMRQNGIITPKRYMANGRYCNEYVYNNLPCNVTVEDWCGEEITEINNEESLEKLVERGDYLSANRLLAQMLRDMTEDNDGGFKKGYT